VRLTKYLFHPSLFTRKLRWQMLYAGARRDVTVESYNGRLTFDSRDKLIGKTLYVNHAYERRHLEDAQAVLAAGGYLPKGRDLLIDVGANIGMICVAFLKHRWATRAMAFEPAPENFRLLLHNVAQNGLADRIQCMPYALSSQAGELELELSDYNSGDHRIRHAAAAGAYREDQRPTVRVAVRSLDSALAEAGTNANAVQLVWVDIQGHEARFLQGARNTIARRVPVVSEFWPYGIFRSGTTREEYVSTVSSLFTHFHRLGRDSLTRHPIAEIDRLFDELAGPKENGQLVLVNIS
jgi:FkbM family methyltransferase